jgi:hypothetical protein
MTNNKIVPENTDNNHFKFIYWFIVGITTFGAFLSVFTIFMFPKDMAGRFADVALIFWLSTAVSGGIGYLIGSSFQKTKEAPPVTPGKVTADITANITSEPNAEEKV